MIFVATIVISLSQNLIQINLIPTLNQSSHPFVLCLGVVDVLTRDQICQVDQVMHGAEYRLNN